VSALLVLSPGLLTTVQDLGRPGLGAWGVPRGGALDPDGLVTANRLVGNPDGAAGLEVWFRGPRLRAAGEVRLAVAGPFGPAPGRVLSLAAGEEIDLSPAPHASRAVVAFAGGIDVPRVLDSRSTSVAAGFGGFSGRPLRKGDRLGVGVETTARLDSVRPVERQADGPDPLVLACLDGPQAALFPPDALATLTGGSYRIASDSNRAGFRLDGPSIRWEGPELPSEGATVGSIQVPPSGQPIVLLNEGPVTGGYAKLAVLPRAELTRLVRCPIGRAIRFRRVPWPSRMAP